MATAWCVGTLDFDGGASSLGLSTARRNRASGRCQWRRRCCLRLLLHRFRTSHHLLRYYLYLGKEHFALHHLPESILDSSVAVEALSSRVKARSRKLQTLTKHLLAFISSLNARSRVWESKQWVQLVSDTVIYLFSYFLLVWFFIKKAKSKSLKFYKIINQTEI